MRLVIDCFKLVKGAGKSIGIYNLALNLTKELARRNRGKNKIIVLGNSYNREDFDIEGVRFVEIPKNPLNKLQCISWELFGVSFVAKKLKADKLLFPRGFATMLHLTKEYIIVHDMIPFYYDKNYPGYFNRLENFYIMWRLKASIRSADKTITISEASKADIMKYAKVDETRMVVINNGYNQIDVSAIEKNTQDKYIIAVTSALPHKNAEGVVKSYEQYCKKVSNPLPLKIIGINAIDEYGLDRKVSDKITCIKYVENDRDLHQLISNASAFMFLSLIEGFGFPPIEAMQLETPVICSNLSSLPEVVGDAAILVNPNDYEQVADGLEKLLDSSSLEVKQLCEQGKENIRRFDWSAIGDKYREILFE